MTTMADIKAHAKGAGSHWFDADTMRFFRCRIMPTVYDTPHGLAFVSSEQGPNTPRAYSVRLVTLNPWTIGKYPTTTFQGFSTAASAKAFLMKVKVPGS